MYPIYPRNVCSEPSDMPDVSDVTHPSHLNIYNGQDIGWTDQRTVNENEIYWMTLNQNWRYQKCYIISSDVSVSETLDTSIASDRSDRSGWSDSREQETHNNNHLTTWVTHNSRLIDQMGWRHIWVTGILLVDWVDWQSMIQETPDACVCAATNPHFLAGSMSSDVNADVTPHMSCCWFG